MNKIPVMVAVLACLSTAPGCQTKEDLTAEGNQAAALEAYEEALDNYDAALKSAPGFRPALLGKARAYEAWGKPAEAEAWYRKVLAAHLDSSEARAELIALCFEQARVLQEQGDHAAATVWLRKVLGLKQAPADAGDTARERIAELDFLAFRAKLTPAIEKLSAYDAEQGGVVVSGKGRLPRRGSRSARTARATKAALHQAHSKLNRIAHQLSSRADDPAVRPEGMVPGAVLDKKSVERAGRVLGLKVILPAEDLARLVHRVETEGEDE